MEEQVRVKCELCKKEIPKSTAVTSEGAEYTFYFCCPDCRDHYFSKMAEKEGDKNPGG